MIDPAADDEGMAGLLDALDGMVARAGALDPQVPAELWKRALLGPAGGFLRRPGKEFRGRLTHLAWRGAGGPRRGAMPPTLPWLVELIHAGSLIVDDVQDDSSTRRGQPALHRQIGAPLAINTGTWMYFWALSLIEELPLPPLTRAELCREAVSALMRCHHGQALDLSVHVGHLEPRHIPATVAATTRNKTGVLMGLAARVGALAAGAAPAQVAAIATLGEELGIGLQMLDDLSGICARSRRDKGLEDLRGGRPTWPWAWLCAAVDELAVARLQQRLRAAPGNEHEEDAVMTALRDGALATGRPAVRAQLQRCVRDAACCLELDAHHALTKEIERLEESYACSE